MTALQMLYIQGAAAISRALASFSSSGLRASMRAMLPRFCALAPMMTRRPRCDFTIIQFPGVCAIAASLKGDIPFPDLLALIRRDEFPHQPAVAAVVIAQPPLALKEGDQILAGPADGLDHLDGLLE